MVEEVKVKERVGLHEVEFLPPRTIVIAWTGDVNEAETRTIADFIQKYTGEMRCVSFATDVGRLGKMPPEAREPLLSIPPPAGNAPRAFRLAFAGANVRTKMIMSVLIAAAKLTQRDSLRSRFFSSIDDAIAWAFDQSPGAPEAMSIPETSAGMGPNRPAQS